MSNDAGNVPISHPGSLATGTKPRVACREIQEADLPKLPPLLREGFPGRPLAYWQTALGRLASYASPPAVPRFGYLLAAEGEPVGIMLLIHSRLPETGAIRCNVSSWYVRPAWRAHAALLNQRAVRNRFVTYVNISPAPHTRPIIEALGFAPIPAGLFAGVALPAPPRAGIAAHILADPRRDPGRLPSPAISLLSDHVEFGCLALRLDTPEAADPFVFRRRMLRGVLPCAMLIACPSLELLEQHAAPIGAALRRAGLPLLLASSPRRLRGFAGRHFPGRFCIYAKGEHPPEAGDLAYTEAAVFGM